jgi:SAM-dependent methyltransferase
MTAPAKKPDYGLDAPPVIAIQLGVAAVCLVAAVTVYLLGAPHPAGFPVFEVTAIVAINCLLIAGAMVYYSRVGKLHGRGRILDLVPWRGNETVLDVGCGRGLMLVAAAKRLTTGKAVGVDLWQAVDLSGNRPDATIENARLEGVADRVEVKDGDARNLPFPDRSFDVVVSNLALHNIPDRDGRRKAAREIARVLRPGGHVVIVDIQATADYAAELAAAGLTDVRRFAGGWVTWVSILMTWGGVRPFRVTGRKPAEGKS